jgi:tRNA pseudouridine38-40 synthase
MKRVEILRQGDYVVFEFEGKGFLKHMVRNFVGTLIYVGKNKIPAEQVKTILETCDRKVAGPTAPSHGLCLIKVEY